MFDFDDSLGFQLSRTSRLLSQLLGSRLQSHGLTAPQWAALSYVAQYPDRHQERLAVDLGSDAATLVGVLRRLEDRGLIERVPDPSDGRRRLVRATDTSGVQAGAKLAHEANEVALAGFTAQERDALRGFLERIQRNATDALTGADAGVSVSSGGESPDDEPR